MASTNKSGNGRLEEAMAVLLQNQATFVQSQAAFLAQLYRGDSALSLVIREGGLHRLGVNRRADSARGG